MGKRHHHHRQPRPPEHARPDRDPSPSLARLIRTQCTDCHAPVEWLTDDETQARGVNLRPALHALGLAPTTVGTATGAEVWACTRCDNYGVMGAPVYGTL